MKLYFYVPDDRTNLRTWYFVEFGLLIANYLLIFMWMIVTPRMRLHVHYKIYVQAVYCDATLFVTARLVVLGYFLEFWSFDKEAPAEENPAMIVCAVGRISFIIGVVTITYIIFIERELSLYFIEDYEYTLRLWIPLLLIFLSFFVGVLFSLLVIYEIVSYFPAVTMGAITTTVGAVLYLFNFYKTWKLNYALKRRLPCRLKYSLSVRYQLEENIWFTEMMATAQLVFGSAVLVTLIIFLGSNFPFISNESREIMDLVCNLLAAADAPIFSVGMFIHNKYIAGVFKGLFFGAEVEPDQDDGDFYFDQLLVQWEGPETKKVEINGKKNRSLLIYIYFVYVSFLLYVTARIIVLAYLNGYITVDKTIQLQENPVIVLCALWRMFYHTVIMTITVIIAVERELSLLYAQDYEYTVRLWIPLLLITISACFGVSVSIGAVLEIVPFLPGVIICGLFAILGLLSYLSSFRRTWKLNYALKRRLPCRLKYSLSVRYQLEENIWFSEIMINAQVIVAFTLGFICLSFLFANMPSFNDDTREIFDIVFHILVAVGPLILAFGTFIQNKYMIGIIKGLFFGAQVEPDQDDGDFYFDQLLVQWEGPGATDRETKKNRTFLMWLLRLKE